MPLDSALLDRFHQTLVDEIRRSRPAYLTRPFTVAEIYQDLVPYHTHRDIIGVAMNGDYEDTLLRLLGGEGGYLILDSDPARSEIERELKSGNPNTSLYREFANLDVRINPESLERARPGGEPASGATDPPQRPDVASAGGRIWAIDDSPPAPPNEPSPPAAEAPTPPAASEEPVVEDEPSIETTAQAKVYQRAEAAGSAPAHAAEATCAWCAEPLPARAAMNFCPHCGGDLRTSPCRACGEAVEPSWRFCVTCGAAAASD